jgi:GTPase SAR1 family protein
MRGGEGFIIVYSISDSKSFLEASEFRSKILQVKESNKVPIIFVGNKADLEGKKIYFRKVTKFLKFVERRQVTKVEGENLAKSYSIPFFETSAALGVNCDEIFLAMAREIRKSRTASP